MLLSFTLLFSSFILFACLVPAQAFLDVPFSLPLENEEPIPGGSSPASEQGSVSVLPSYTADSTPAVKPLSSGDPLGLGTLFGDNHGLLVPPDSTPSTIDEPVPSAHPDVIFVTVTEPAVVITTIMLNKARPTTSTTTSQRTRPPTTTTATSSPLTTWTSPPKMTDLSNFGVQASFYSSNIHFVTAVPTSAFSAAASPGPSSDPSESGPDTLEDDELKAHSRPTPPPPSTNKLQIKYPKGSINPAGSIKGGADFYANPFSAGVLESARTLSLSYRVLFSNGFDFVKGGKMPGLYGGPRGCSGGKDAGASACFSTRLMWRPRGEGELYLYAPRDKQAKGVCKTHPKSVCSDDYGMSIGRGSFRWATGRWTEVRQTVRLNTPGKADGRFGLELDGMKVLDVDGVFFRDGDGMGSNLGKTDPDPDPDPETKDDGGGLLGDLLGEVGDVGSILQTLEKSASSNGSPAPPNPDIPIPVFISRKGQFYVNRPIGAVASVPLPPPAPLEEALAFSISSDGQVHLDTPVPANLEGTPNHIQGLQSKPKNALSPPAGFSGMFFSTFFGGHDAEWASPRDQYAWFDSFRIDVLE
jgi:hypothetical protein